MTIDLSDDADSDDEGEIPRTANQGLAADCDSDSDSNDEDDTGSDREPAGEQVVVEDVDENDPSEADDGAPATPPRLPEMLGRGMRIRRKPEAYIPSTKGKKYELGVLNMCYRGNRYKLKDGILSVNVNS